MLLTTCDRKIPNLATYVKSVLFKYDFRHVRISQGDGDESLFVLIFQQILGREREKWFI